LLTSIRIARWLVHACVIAVNVRIYFITWFDQTKFISVGSRQKWILHLFKCFTSSSFSKIRGWSYSFFVLILKSTDASKIWCNQIIICLNIATLIYLVFTWAESLLRLKCHHLLIFAQMVLVQLLPISIDITLNFLARSISKLSCIYVLLLNLNLVLVRYFLKTLVTLLDSWTTRTRLILVILSCVLRRTQKRLFHTKRIV